MSTHRIDDAVVAELSASSVSAVRPLDDERLLRALPQSSRAGVAVIATLCGVFLATSSFPLGHSDLWGHLNFGRWIAEHGTLPTADPFRSYAVADTFSNVPWLSQLAGYWVYTTLGAGGLQLAHAVLAMLTCGLVMRAIRASGAATAWAVAGGAAWFVLSLPIIGTIRPQLLGGMCFALVLGGLTALPTRRHPLAWMPPVFAAWANVHGSFVMGLVVLGAWCLGTTWEGLRWPDSGGRVLTNRLIVGRGWLLFALSLGACCLNPHGVQLFPGVLRFADNPALASISEWKPLVLGSLSGALFFSSLLVTGVLLRFSRRTVRLHEILILVAFAAAALLAMRMLAWWALVWPWIAVPHAASCVTGRSTARRAAGRKQTAVAMAVVFATLIWAPPSFALVSGAARPEGAIVADETPLYVADEMDRRALSGRFYAPIDWADYLTWRGRGRLEPLAYAHVHLVAPSAWRDLEQLRRGGPGWLTVVDHYRLDYLVLSTTRNRDLLSLVIDHPRFTVVYRDQRAVLLAVRPAAEDVSAE